MSRCSFQLATVGLLAAAVAFAATAADVRQVMKPARYSRGDENVRIVQPADAAAWIWMPGHEIYGVAAAAQSWKDKASKGEVPGWFFRFRNDFNYLFAVRQPEL